MRFAWPEVLWLLLLVPGLALAYVQVLRRRRRAAVSYSSLILVRAAMGQGRAWRRHLPPALFLAAMTFALIATARPSAVLMLPSEAITLVLAMDVSRSMRATDVAPNRITASQTAAKAFVEGLPRNIRLGIVSFAGTAAVVQTPTDNKDDLVAAIDRFQLQRGTATGNGLLMALAMLFPDDDIGLEAALYGAEFARGGHRVSSLERRGQSDKRPKKDFKPVPPGSYTAGTIVLLSDGRRTMGIDPVEAARMAANRGVRVHTVGFGSREGAMVNVEGWSFFAMLDEEALKAVATVTGGEYFNATNAADLQKVYDKLNVRLALERRETEIGGILAAAAALLLITAALLSLLWFHRRI